MTEREKLIKIVADATKGISRYRVAQIVDRLFSEGVILPSSEGTEVVRAEWVGTEYDGYADGYPVYDKWECSLCHEEFLSDGEPPPYNYCPYCGAKMDGERREE